MVVAHVVTHAQHGRAHPGGNSAANGVVGIATDQAALRAQHFAVQVIALNICQYGAVQVDLMQMAAAVIEVLQSATIGQLRSGAVAEGVVLVLQGTSVQLTLQRVLSSFLQYLTQQVVLPCLAGLQITLCAELLGLHNVTSGAVAVCQSRLQHRRLEVGYSGSRAWRVDVFLNELACGITHQLGVNGVHLGIPGYDIALTHRHRMFCHAYDLTCRVVMQHLARAVDARFCHQSISSVVTELVRLAVFVDQCR